MKLVYDNTKRMEHLTALLRVCTTDITKQPIPQDMRDLLMALDVEALEDDLRDALAMGSKSGTELKLVA